MGPRTRPTFAAAVASSTLAGVVTICAAGAAAADACILSEEDGASICICVSVCVCVVVIIVITVVVVLVLVVIFLASVVHVVVWDDTVDRRTGDSINATIVCMHMCTCA